jgi:Skp family chaperone for outer membrane proteins
MFRFVPAALAAALFAFPAMAQQGQWFVPGQGQQQGQQRPAQPPRPAQAPAQRPAQPDQQPLPPGQSTPTPVIGIVDVPEIQRISTAFTQVREEVERRRAALNEDLQREQQRWRDEQQRLATERPGLTPEQLRARERDLQDRITDSQRALRDRAANIEQVAQAALREIEQALAVIIRQVATARNINIVLPRPLVIYNDPPFDLTQEIAVELNRVLPRLNLPAEAAEAPAPAQPRAQQQPQRQGGAQPQGQQQRRN